uniref:Uncharacterized protein n=1 Tax=Solanum tuberosum TaxID=4113 RepID=M1DIF7_SOLTU
MLSRIKTNRFAFELFFCYKYLEVVCVDKLANHPYFTRSKAPKDSFPHQSSHKGKTTIGNNDEEISLTDVIVAQAIIADQNELIMQLMQQITELKAEAQRTQGPSNPIISVNPLDEGRPSLHFPHPCSRTEYAQNPLPNPAQSYPIIDLTALNPHHAFASHEAPPYPHNINLHTFPPPPNANPQAFPIQEN